ncbi:hypothetical protein GDO78_002332 [Eleutherodactylus coqui]|uniref:Uncharacterized protein n=1 Tax=Eleutherodactylus coqui TaxID=57060 RepID=A0A8J6EY98_ELECQ|nr:hypothetical protein GDO78_002332 [Eleutherodactylus coqui]
MDVRLQNNSPFINNGALENKVQHWVRAHDASDTSLQTGYAYKHVTVMGSILLPLQDGGMLPMARSSHALLIAIKAIFTKMS